jgi:hypothetical protein
VAGTLAVSLWYRRLRSPKTGQVTNFSQKNTKTFLKTLKFSRPIVDNVGE